MTGEAWLLIAAGLAVGGVASFLVAGIAWSNGYAAGCRKVTDDWWRTSEMAREAQASIDAMREGADPIEHFPAGWPDKTVVN